MPQRPTPAERPLRAGTTAAPPLPHPGRRRLCRAAAGGGLCAAAGVGLLAACASIDRPAAADAARPVWPAPPELPRYAFEATLRNAASVRADGDSLRRQLTGADDAASTFNKPLAVAARYGRVYVSDTEARRIFVFDLPRRRTFSFGLRREGQLKKPNGVAVDDEGRVYVVDTTARRLVVYDALGLYLDEIDGGAWQRPTAVAVRRDGGRICVVDTGGVDSGQHGLWLYERGADGRPGARGRFIGGRGEAPGRFNLPADAAFAADGTLWALDAGNFRVQRLDAEGRFVFAFGSAGDGLAQLARPRGLAVGPDGLVYVADALLCNVQVFGPDGQLRLTLGGRAAGTGRNQPGRYLLPARLACDEGSRLYVVDQFLHKVDVIRRLDDAEGLRLMQRVAPG